MADYSNFKIRVPRMASDAPVLKEILKNLYGIKFARIALLAGYDDLNFKLTKCEFVEGYGFDQKFGESFTLKFSNPWESRHYPELCDAQLELSTLLAQTGMNCPQLIKQKDGKAHSLVRLGLATQLTPVRLFTFIPGQTMEEWLLADKANRVQPDVLKQLATAIGELLGKFHATLDCANFCPEVFQKYSPLISLECWPQLRGEFEMQKTELNNILDNERVNLCEAVFEQFEQDVFKQRHNFKHGLIHSDFNEANILLFDKPVPEICGLLDFGDSHHSIRVADLANAILYFYLLLREHFPNDNNEEMLKNAVNNIYSGFSKSAGTLQLPNFDLSYLRLFLRARLVSSLVYGLRTLRMEKDTAGHQPMEYVLKTQQKGWTVLKELAESNEHLLCV